MKLIESLINSAQSQLQQFAQRADFSDKMMQTFGTSPAGLQGAWANGMVIMPEIELVSSGEIDGANGAFAATTNRIYLAQEFLRRNTHNLDAVVKTVLEEYGHYLDNFINDVDTKGDEGAKFAAFVRGENLSVSQLGQLDNEDDHATVVLGGETVEIEKDDSSFDIVFDYRFDTNGFFDDAARRATLEAAGQIWANLIEDEFDNIPAGIQFTIQNPQTGQEESITLTNEIDDLLIFVGSQSPPFGISGNALGRGGPRGNDAAGDIFRNRYNSSDFEPFAGNISFDPTPSFSNGSSADWFFDSTPDTADDIPTNTVDFLETALHEIGHVLGIGTASIFDQIGQDGAFDGPNSLTINGGNPIPLASDLSHTEANFTTPDGIISLMEPSGGSRLPTSVDLAMLADIGYETVGFQAQGFVAPIATDLGETIFGTIIDDVIDGLGGNDQIQGDQGNDTLIGGAGNDTLVGSAGIDTFRFEANNGQDIINDFDITNEVIQIASDLGFTTGAEILATLTKPFSNVSRFTLSAGNYIDVFHESTSGTPLTAANFAIVSDSVNNNPVANDDSATTSEDRSVIIKVLNNDTDAEGNLDLNTLQIVQPNNGTARYISSTGEIVYTPNRDFFGEDSFTYTIQDTEGGTSNVATVNLTVNSVNDVPVAIDDNNTQPEDTEKVPFIIDEDTSITIDVLANDVDVENGIDPQTVTIVDRPLNGRFTINNTGQITYTPNNNFFGNDSFTYTVQDSNGATSNPATVDIRVNSVNDNPTANNDTATTERGKSVIINVLNNDSDVELGNLTVSVANNNSANARFYVNPLTGEITYTPEVNTIGNDSFEYTITDENGGTATATVNVSVTPEDIINPIPIDNNNFTTQEDTSIIIDPRDDEENAENINENSVIDVITGPNNGSFRVDPITKEITYTPNRNFFGNDSFTYTIVGGSQLINEVVNITVQPVNDVPVAVNDNSRTNENESVDISVLDNDIEIETDINDLNITVENAPRNGTFSINSNGTITYTPNNNFNGLDSFTYTIEDENGAVSNVARVEVIVDPINDIPVAVDDVGTTEIGSSLILDVLSNDSDVEGEIDITTLQIGTLPTNGTVEIIPTTGEIIYTPTGLIGEDSFTYTVQDTDDATSTSATVRINVTPRNVPPVANDDIVTTPEDTTVEINVLGNDVDTNFDLSSVQIGSNPNNGTLNFNRTTGTISYRPNDNFAGEDSFTYTVKDTNGVVSNPANVNVTVTPVNDIPVANNDSLIIQQGEDITVNIKVLDNDSDVENGIDETTVQIVRDPNRGTATVNPTTGEVTYTPDSDFFGRDSFTYTFKDTDGATSSVGTVNIFVNPSDENNTRPVANDDSVTAVENTALVIDVLGNDEDAENNIDATTVEVDSDPENGTVRVDEITGEITYLPNNDFIGADSFSYTVKDRNGVTSNAATVNVIVNQGDPEPANFNAAQILDLDGDVGQTKQLKISFVSQNTNLVNEIGVFRVDDELGTINGISPDDSEYLQAALANSQVVFSSLPNNVLGGVDFTRQINFNGSDRLVFYLVQDSTTQTVLSDLAAGRNTANVLFALPNANSNGFDPVEISELDQRTFSLSWTDGDQSSFDNFVFNVEILQTDSTPIGTGLQGKIELIDLRDLGTLTATFNIASEAAFDNTIGWYIVDDENGSIGGLNPGDRGYAQIAISQRSIASFTRDGIESAQLRGLLAPYLIADSSRDDFLEDNPLNFAGEGPLAYFAFSAANPDGVDHILQLGDNTFGFEDLENGGDRDFNDIIMQVNFT
ncbi:tandem-95 repeat protein [Okeanomitos corallinicola TIOX110]|uniref:Tandem-95 repeat protein n=1 Tax=Okeanomitos corallinicola TIOX110 TaxID=3133117 RepID=A0ABZ2UWW6_9CYAN